MGVYFTNIFIITMTKMSTMSNNDFMELTITTNTKIIVAVVAIE